ncbi:translocation and assembly module lipoprotein TamL [Spongiivirga citrea]|uniref:BamA/TamA family outer membrane protein n=1 Tax=Spongiivirga citrea TaxID=1481457 RepID=A0A6M0CK67_9FLAO|nr:BamA/TamA family outer membrane protein [Spongiivirga citrea]NER18325.1 BamA/TamA family outer membrane protein [Spongiivirga citrea]
MKLGITKIGVLIVISILFFSCNTIKKVGEEELLLTDNTIIENGKKIKDDAIESLFYQTPNSKLLGTPVRLHIFNLARDNRDSIFKAWVNSNEKRKKRLFRRYSKKQINEIGNYAMGFNRWLRETGEAPAIIDESKTEKTRKKIKSYYDSNGYFNNVVTDSLIKGKKPQRAEIFYSITTGNPYFIDSITVTIESQQLDSVYQLHKDKAFVQQGKQYKNSDFVREQSRLNELFRNSGFFTFQKNSIHFYPERDTIPEHDDYLMPTELYISDGSVRDAADGETRPYKVHTIRRVNIFTDNKSISERETASDSIVNSNYHVYSSGELKFRPKALTDATFIIPNDIYSDKARVQTNRSFNKLQTFRYPNIEYEYIGDSDTDLEANIFLIPRKRFSIRPKIEFSHSDIQDFGISAGLDFTARNVFRGAETLQLSLSGTLGSTNDPANNDNRFFNISEVGGDLKLDFPRFFFPFNTEKIIPKYMLPTTQISLGVSLQENIGLDRQNFTGILRYNWEASTIKSHALDLINIQFVNNKNINNYFEVYRNSYNELNGIAQDNIGLVNPDQLNTDGNLIIPSGTDSFIDDVVNGSTALSVAEENDVRNILERKERLTQNNLIFASSYTFTKNNRQGFLDNNFSQFRTKIEFAGNLLSAVSGAFNFEKDGDQAKVFDVAFTQYAKTEIDYIKYWQLSANDALAFRTFAGVAIPYGNSSNIPFARSYFGGGSNDNRAWQAYSLGPGSSGSPNEFNEANLKLAANLEYRFKLFGKVNGAFFADAGNIWNVFDDTPDEAAQFNGFSSLKDLALGSGFGIRYDFGFLVLRLDTGFKTYDPALPENDRWFRNFNFSNAVYNIGINYPF